MEIMLFVGALVLLDLLAQRFGYDSRGTTPIEQSR
jgi:hypothetical protein